MLCVRIEGISALVIKLTQCKSGSKRLGLGCHMWELFTSFGDNKLPQRLDVLAEDRNFQHYSLQGRHYGHMERRVVGPDHWDPHHHHLGLIVPRPELLLSPISD